MVILSACGLSIRGETPLFNRLQLPFLIAELETLRTRCKTREALDQLEALIKFVEQDKGVHTYLKFYGD